MLERKISFFLPAFFIHPLTRGQVEGKDISIFNLSRWPEVLCLCLSIYSNILGFVAHKEQDIFAGVESSPNVVIETGTTLQA
jgi:hypothetical protein